MAKQYSKKPAKPQTQPKAEPKQAISLSPLIPDSLAKKIFWGLAAILLVTMLAVSHQYGISGDENFHREYGHRVLNYYTSLGNDSTCTMAQGPDSLMRFYGGFYDGTAAALHKALPSVNEWSVRHAWNSIFGFVAMLCASLVVVEIAGWQAGLIALLFMIFSPRFFGESMNNPKDITMAAGYMLSYVFIIRFLKQLPKPNWKAAIALGLSIGMAMGIRIGGLLLIPYLFLFYGLAMVRLYGWAGVFDFSKFKEQIWPSFKWVLVASVMGYVLALIFWPFGLVSPIHNPLEALGVAEKFPVTMRMLFDGQYIRTAKFVSDDHFVSQVPWYYEPKWFLISTPLFGLLGAVASIILIPQMRSEKKLLFLGFVYFTLFFPIFYVAYKHAVLYDTMRHFFFVYPSIIMLSALTFNYLINRFQRNIKYAVAGVMLVLIALPARFMIANHPNEYVYFNELIGGIKGAAANFETDYYMNSVKQCADWLKANENLKPEGRKVLIYTNAVDPVTHYFENDREHVAPPGFVSYSNRGNKDADYEILYSRFVDRPLLLNGCFPPEQAVFVVTVDGVPISCVVKKTDRGEYLGYAALQKGDFAGAVQALQPYCQKYPRNDAAWANLGIAYLNSATTAADVQKGIEALSNSYNLNDESINTAYMLSQAYKMIGNNSMAQQMMGRARELQDKMQ